MTTPRAGTFEAFEGNVLVQDGVIRNIGVIGEAAVKIQQVDPELVVSRPDIPWKDMQTMRHKLVHNYFDVDLAIVWSTVQQDLPKLATQIRQVLAVYNAPGSELKR